MDGEVFDEYEEDGALVERYLHLVWSTRGQQPWLDGDWSFELGLYLSEVMVNNDGVLLASGGGLEHIHLLVSLPATLSLEEAVRLLKLSSAYWIRQTIAHRKEFAWQQSAFVVTIAPEEVEVARATIHHQHEYHEDHPYREELLAFLAAHHFPFEDEAELWQ